jgi:hypothetical protein
LRGGQGSVWAAGYSRVCGRQSLATNFTNECKTKPNVTAERANPQGASPAPRHVPVGSDVEKCRAIVCTHIGPGSTVTLFGGATNLHEVVGPQAVAGGGKCKMWIRVSRVSRRCGRACYSSDLAVTPAGLPGCHGCHGCHGRDGEGRKWTVDSGQWTVTSWLIAEICDCKGAAGSCRSGDRRRGDMMHCRERLFRCQEVWVRNVHWRKRKW